jgi:hypothetical protein
LTYLILVFVIPREAESSSFPLKMIAVVAAVAKECTGISQNELTILPDYLRDFLRCNFCFAMMQSG